MVQSTLLCLLFMVTALLSVASFCTPTQFMRKLAHKRLKDTQKKTSSRSKVEQVAGDKKVTWNNIKWWKSCVTVAHTHRLVSNVKSFTTYRAHTIKMNTTLDFPLYYSQRELNTNQPEEVHIPFYLNDFVSPWFDKEYVCVYIVQLCFLRRDLLLFYSDVDLFFLHRFVLFLILNSVRSLAAAVKLSYRLCKRIQLLCCINSMYHHPISKFNRIKCNEIEQYYPWTKLKIICERKSNKK